MNFSGGASSGDEEDPIRIRPALLRDAAYVVVLVFSGGVFYAQQIAHDKWLTHLQALVDAQAIQVESLKDRHDVLESRVLDIRSQLDKHIDHDVQFLRKDR